MSERDALRLTFDEAAEAYDAARPAYPSELIDDLVALSRLGGNSRILEIGCGTGQATLPLARRGYAIDCVELGENLAALARAKLRNFPRVRVITCAFEAWQPGDEPYDLVLAATSWHWLDPAVAYAKAASVLTFGGVLAVVETNHVLPGGGDGFFREVQDDYALIGEVGPGPPRPEEVPDKSGEIEASGLFEDVSVSQYVESHEYTAAEYVALLDTYSGHRAMEPGSRHVLYRAIERRIAARARERVSKHYLFRLYVVRRRLGGLLR